MPKSIIGLLHLSLHILIFISDFRLDNMTKSPLLSHLATSIQGSSTIKAYKMEKQFQLKYV